MCREQLSTKEPLNDDEMEISFIVIIEFSVLFYGKTISATFSVLSLSK